MLADEDLTKAQRENVSIIRGAGKSLLNLINDILDFSKIEAGQIDIEMIDCSLGKLLKSIESMMLPLAKEKSLDFKTIADSDLPAQMHSDPFRLQQCLVNLVNNALKFTEQGHVHVKISLHQDNDRHLIRFDVEDTGIGIPEDRQQAIFESFTQVNGTTARKYGGTGLGLTVTQQLVGLLGGELTLTSVPGKGSVFSLSIPAGVDITGHPLLDRDEALDQEVDGAPEFDTALFSGRVLVAEDVESNQRLMVLMLSKLGLDPVIAQDGQQAVNEAMSRSFDLVFMDMQMPNMNGYEATHALRQQGYKAPIVALTANAMKGDDQKCIDAGCDCYLTKPIDRRELLKISAKYLPAKQAIETTDDEDIIRTIMPSCVEDIKELFEQLDQAVKAGDCESIASHAHALQGMAGNLSLERLSDIADQIERAGRDNDIEVSTLHFNSLRIEVEKVLTVLSPCARTEKAKMA